MCPEGSQQFRILFLVTKPAYFDIKLLSRWLVHKTPISSDKVLWYQTLQRGCKYVYCSSWQITLASWESYPEMETSFLFLVTRYLNKKLMFTECTNDVSRHCFGIRDHINVLWSAAVHSTDKVLWHQKAQRWESNMTCRLLSKYFVTNRWKTTCKLVSYWFSDEKCTQRAAPWCQSTKVGFWLVLCQ